MTGNPLKFLKMHSQPDNTMAEAHMTRRPRYSSAVLLDNRMTIFSNELANHALKGAGHVLRLVLLYFARFNHFMVYVFRMLVADEAF